MTRILFYIFTVLFFLFGLRESFSQQDTTRQNNQQRRIREVKWVNPEIPVMEGLTHKVLKSDALGHDVGYVVWTPAGYNKTVQTRYPVIYFLHGMGGNESADAAAFSGFVSNAIKDELLPPVICVFPNGGLSGYRNEVEKMIINELIPLIDREYCTLPNAQSRMVIGFSMGGSGSVNMAVKYPDLFCIAGSMGGGFRSIEQNLPDIEKAIPVWKKNNFAFFLVNGDNDRPEAFKDFSVLLNKNEIVNKVIVLTDQGHDLGKYYKESLGELFKLIKAHLKTESE